MKSSNYAIAKSKQAINIDPNLEKCSRRGIMNAHKSREIISKWKYQTYNERNLGAPQGRPWPCRNFLPFSPYYGPFVLGKRNLSFSTNHLKIAAIK